MKSTLEALDCGDFLNAIVNGDEFGPCFTMNKETAEWGCAPEDNRTTWERLREQAGFRLDEEAEAALNALIERP